MGRSGRLLLRGIMLKGKPINIWLTCLLLLTGCGPSSGKQDSSGEAMGPLPAGSPGGRINRPDEGKDAPTADDLRGDGRIRTGAEELLDRRKDEADRLSGGSFPPDDPEATGSFSITTLESQGGKGKVTVYYPEDTGSGRRHPVIAWANSTMMPHGSYKDLLQRLASHGFIVVASHATMALVSNDQISHINWIRNQDTQAGSPFYGRIHATAFGVAGHSQGGSATLNSAGQGLIRAAVPVQPCAGSAPRATGATLLISSSADTYCSPALIRGELYNSTGGTVGSAHLTGEGHFNITTSEKNGEMLGLIVSWFRLHLMADQTMGTRLSGEGCRYCTAPWTLKSK